MIGLAARIGPTTVQDADPIRRLRKHERGEQDILGLFSISGGNERGRSWRNAAEKFHSSDYVPNPHGVESLAN